MRQGGGGGGERRGRAPPPPPPPARGGFSNHPRFSNYENAASATTIQQLRRPRFGSYPADSATNEGWTQQLPPESETKRGLDSATKEGLDSAALDSAIKKTLDSATQTDLDSATKKERGNYRAGSCRIQVAES